MQEQNNEQPSFYAIIPATLRYDKRIIPNAKLLYGEITALCNKEGYCWANNQYFADLYDVDKATISRWIACLISFDYLKVSYKYKDGTKQIENRYLHICNHPIDEKINTLLTKSSLPYTQKCNTPIDEKIKDNNTSINNTINNTNEYIGAIAFSHKKNDLPNSLEAEKLEEKEKSCAKKEKEYGRNEFIADCVTLGAEKQHVLDWVKVRASKKAQPTKTALKSIIEECNKHDFPFSEAVRICAEHSWAGFKFQWYQNLINDGKAKKPAATFTKESIERQFDAIDRMFKR